jgi:pimeloyl-ACP methyl ester carboxylesterase
MTAINKYALVLVMAVGFGCSSGTDISIEYLNQKYTDDKSGFMKIEGANLHYKDEGKGPTLVLLHGIGSSLHTWDGWADALSNDFRIIRFDLPGFGLTGADSSNNYSMERYRSILHKFLDSLGVNEHYMVGNSLGGWLAWEYTLDHPDKVKKLILIAAAGFITPDNPPKPLRIAQKFKKSTVKGAPRFAVKKFLKQAYGDKSKVSDMLIDRYYELNSRPGNGLAFYEIANAQYHPRSSRLPEIDIPVLIMWGSEDKKWIEVRQAYLFEELLPNDKVLIYEGLGHLPMEEDPLTTVNDAKKFLME